jgi:glucoamylase
MAWARAGVALGAVALAGLALSGAERGDPETPAALPGLPPPFLGVAVVGSGRRAAAVDAYGNVVDLREPGPADRASVAVSAKRQAAGTVAPGEALVARAQLQGERSLPLWRADSIRQRYLPGANVLRTIAWFGDEKVVVVRSHGGADAARADRRWLALAKPLGRAAPRWARAMYRRSLLVLWALTDRRTGAVAAGARDGWAYVWPRDAAAVAIAFASAGYAPEAHRIARFLLRLDLTAAARFDGTGAPVRGRDAQGDARGWVAAAAKAAGLPVPGADLGWRGLADYQEGGRGDYVGNAIASAADGPKPRLYGGKSAHRQGGGWVVSAFGTPRGLLRMAGDPGSGLDSAAAWAVRPFYLPALFPAARRTLLNLTAQRESRYGILPSQNWHGGEDPWTAPTAWTAWSLAELGERSVALRLMADLRRAATPLGLLPERVDARTGLPTSTTPLAWSHAFAILALRELWPGREGSGGDRRQRGGNSLLRRLGRDDARAALHLFPPRDAPAAQGDHGAAQVAGEGDLRERAPFAADRDRRCAGSDHGEVARLADAGGDHLRAVGVRIVDVDPGEDADHRAAGVRCATGGRFHHPAPATADHGRAGLRQAPPDLLGKPPRLTLFAAATGANDGDLPRALRRDGVGLNRTSPLFVRASPTPSLHCAPFIVIVRISSNAPSLCRGSLRFPHLGLCTQEGQPDSQGHSAIRRSASPSRRSNCS